MSVVAILVMWPRQVKHIFVSANSEGYIWNMTTIGLLAFEEMFEIVNLWYFLGQRSNNELGLFSPQIFIYLLR